MPRGFLPRWIVILHAIGGEEEVAKTLTRYDELQPIVREESGEVFITLLVTEVGADRAAFYAQTTVEAALARPALVESVTAAP